MLNTRGREKDLVRPKPLTRAAANKLTAALRHDVNLVTRVRCLRIAAARRVKLYYQRAMLEQCYRSFTLWTRQAFQRL